MINENNFNIYLVLKNKYEEELFFSKNTDIDVKSYLINNGYNKNIEVIQLNSKDIAKYMRNYVNDPFKNDSNDKNLLTELIQNNEIISFDLAQELDYLCGEVFEGSKYVWDPLENSNGGHYDHSELKCREWRDEEMTYVAPTKDELIKYMQYSLKFKDFDIKSVFDNTADQICKIIISKFKKY